MPDKNASDLRIAALPEGNSLWRVDWFGKVDFPKPIERYRQPSVRVALSSVGSFLDRLNSAAKEPVSCWVSVGTLVMLRVGSLFRNRRYQGDERGEVESFTEVEVGERSTEIVKAGSSEGEHYLLPLSHHPEHRQDTKGFCVRVPLPDGRLLLVPCMEIVRFYFGSSSSLLGKLFRPDLQREHLYDPTHSQVGAHRLRSRLMLAEGIRASSANDVARIAGDLAAWRCAVSIGLSMAAPTNDGYVRTGFPFNGQTTLKARGRWLPRGSEPKQTFVAHQLLSCSHPFPFKKLSYRTYEGSSNQSAPQAQEAKVTPPPRASEATRTPSTLVEQDAGGFGAVALHQFAEQRFPDLKRKQVDRDLSETPPAPKGGPAAAAHVDALALGSQGSSEPIRPAELEVKAVDEPPPFLQPIIEILREIPGLRFRPLTGTSGDGWTTPLQYFVSELPRELRLLPDCDGASGGGLRRVSVLRVEMDDCSQVWTVVEHDRLVLQTHPTTEEGDGLLLASSSKRLAEKLRLLESSVDAAREGPASSVSLTDKPALEIALKARVAQECVERA